MSINMLGEVSGKQVSVCGCAISSDSREGACGMTCKFGCKHSTTKNLLSHNQKVTHAQAIPPVMPFQISCYSSGWSSGGFRSNPRSKFRCVGFDSPSLGFLRISADDGLRTQGSKILRDVSWQRNAGKSPGFGAMVCLASLATYPKEAPIYRDLGTSSQIGPKLWIFLWRNKNLGQPKSNQVGEL